MTANLSRCGIEIPQTDPDAAKCVKIAQGTISRISGKHKDRSIGEIPVAVCLRHTSSPVTQFHLERSNRWQKTVQEISAGNRLGPRRRRFPGNGDEISDTKTVDGNLTGTCNLALRGTMVNCGELPNIRLRELDGEAGLCRRCSRLPPREIPLRFSEPNLWHFDCCCISHGLNNTALAS